MNVANLDHFSDGNPKLSLRLKERHKRVIEANRDAFHGRTVLDLAANNGRWSFAAAAAGASKVVSIEGRQERVDEAKILFARFGAADKIDAHVGDMYEFLRDSRGQSYDTVLCLGIYYHVMDHYMLLQRMADLDPRTIIIDSGFVRSFRNSIQVNVEDPSDHSSALARYEGQKKELIGIVSLGLMIQMAWNVGYSCSPVPWNPSDISDKETVHDYMLGRRYTLRLDRTTSPSESDWKQPWRAALSLLNPKFELLLDKATHDLQVDARVRQPFQSMQFTVL